VAAGGFAFHDKSVDHAIRFAGQSDGERGRGDDAQEHGPFQFRRGAAAEHRRVEVGMKLLAGRVIRHVNLQFRGFARRQVIQYAGNRPWNARANQDIVHAGQHGAENRWQRRELNLFEVIDADGPVVPFLG
jgi:hypothetical protein